MRRSENQKVKNKNGKVKHKNEITMWPSWASVASRMVSLSNYCI